MAAATLENSQTTLAHDSAFIGPNEFKIFVHRQVIYGLKGHSRTLEEIHHKLRCHVFNGAI